jgi:hypothetical protein
MEDTGHTEKKKAYGRGTKYVLPPSEFSAAPSKTASGRIFTGSTITNFCEMGLKIERQPD